LGLFQEGNSSYYFGNTVTSIYLLTNISHFYQTFHNISLPLSGNNTLGNTSMSSKNNIMCNINDMSVNQKSATVILTHKAILCTSAADIPLVKNIKLQCTKTKDKCVPIKARRSPLGSRRQRFPEFLDNQHTNMAKFSDLHTGCRYLKDISQILVSVRDSVNTRVMLRPESNRDLPACSAAPQLTAPPRAPCMKITLLSCIPGAKISY
jgi:hypothetical protein